MWNKFKLYPLSVQLSIGFLVAVFIVATIVVPVAGIIIGTIVCGVRVVIHFSERL
jgi:hypothetical protein